MYKTTLLICLLTLTVNGDVLTKETVEDYLNQIESKLYTVEKTCWSEKEEKAADMVAREVKRQFPQIKSALLQQEGDLALPVYNTFKELCKTTENITKEVTSTWSDDSLEHCVTGSDEQQTMFYGLTSEEAQEWIEIARHQMELFSPLVKPVFVATVVAKAETIDCPNNDCRIKAFLMAILGRKSDLITSDWKFHYETSPSYLLPNVTIDKNSYDFIKKKQFLRLRMTSLAGMSCRFINDFAHDSNMIEWTFGRNNITVF